MRLSYLLDLRSLVFLHVILLVFLISMCSSSRCSCSSSSSSSSIYSNRQYNSRRYSSSSRYSSSISIQDPLSRLVWLRVGRVLPVVEPVVRVPGHKPAVLGLAQLYVQTVSS